MVRGWPMRELKGLRSVAEGNVGESVDRVDLGDAVIAQYTVRARAPTTNELVCKESARREPSTGGMMGSIELVINIYITLIMIIVYIHI